MPARSEPLLWVQLIGAGVLPLEALLLLLLLAGSDPGPVPALERVLCWALGGLAPTLLLWHRPADLWSLLVLQTPLRARRPLQQRLSRLQENLGLRLGLALAGASSLPLLWWLDEHAAVASSLSPLGESPRLVVLLLAALLLALMVWQWQQLLQALWLLTRSPDTVASAKPMPQDELVERRLCLGLPLLLLDPLQLAPAPAPAERSGRGATASAESAGPGAGAVAMPEPPPQTAGAVHPESPVSLAEAQPEPEADGTAPESAGLVPSMEDGIPEVNAPDAMASSDGVDASRPDGAASGPDPSAVLNPDDPSELPLDAPIADTEVTPPPAPAAAAPDGEITPAEAESQARGDAEAG